MQRLSDQEKARTRTCITQITAPFRGQLGSASQEETVKTIAKTSVFGTKLMGLAAVLMIAASPQAKAQQAIGGLRIERTGHTATRLPSGNILIVGGENGSGAVRDSEIFDPVSRTFSVA